MKFGGRSLTEAERRYATTDKELLSVFYAVKQCQIYIIGYDYIVYTDYKPLIYLKSFRDVVARRFRWIQFLEELQVKIAYIEGKSNIVADFLSRNIRDQNKWSAISFDSLELAELLYNTADMIAFQREDDQLSSIFNYLEGKVVDKDLIDRKFQKHLHHILIEDGLLKYNNRGDLCIIVTEKLRAEIYEFCHSDWSSGHYGAFKTHKCVLNRLFWWPKLFEDVETYIKNCISCQTIKKVTKELGKLNLHHDSHLDLPDNAETEKQDFVFSDDDEDDDGADGEDDIAEHPPRYFLRNRQNRPYYGY